MLDAARELGADVGCTTRWSPYRQDTDSVTAADPAPRRRRGIRRRRASTSSAATAPAPSSANRAASRSKASAGLGNAITVWIEADLTRYTKHRSGALFCRVQPGQRRHRQRLDVYRAVERVEHDLRPPRHGGRRSSRSNRSWRACGPRSAIPTSTCASSTSARGRFNHVVAAHYRRGRMFIAGDAAHRHPPANGLGSNTSMQDAYNLAWKLALVLSGRAGDGLLDTYDDERQPVGRQIVDRANQSVGEMVVMASAARAAPRPVARRREVSDRRDLRTRR